jgi:hypothetical protein
MDSQGHCWKWGVDTVVEIGANRQSCDPSVMLLFKLVLEAVLGTVRGESAWGNDLARHRP